MVAGVTEPLGIPQAPTIDPRARTAASLSGEPSLLQDQTWDGSVAGLWTLVARIPDPEIPVISIVDLGIVRDIHLTDGSVTVTMTPTYAGCPATEVIRHEIETTLRAVGINSVTVQLQLAPAWTTDWITPAAREALRRYGIAPPCAVAESNRPVHFRPACPRCGSHQTALLSAFGATPCKALYRCNACREPFDFFKPL
jgi:ring-1,2-phenylacetyl-CoA epoxidase subunit PaaD